MLCSIFQKLSFSFLVEGGTRTIPVLHSGHQHAKYSPCQTDRTSVYLRVPLMLNTLDTSDISVVQQLENAGHSGGIECRCSECQRLKDTEDKWICRLGTFNAPHGLNTRDEIKTRSRVNFKTFGTWICIKNLQKFALFTTYLFIYLPNSKLKLKQFNFVSMYFLKPNYCVNISFTFSCWLCS